MSTFIPNNSIFIDPYEQKLFNLFKNFEIDGKLNESGLRNLCQTLQLKERLTLLISILFKNGSKTGVTFEEFREGLLHVITSEDDETSASTTTQVSLTKPLSDNESDREISPKYIVGTKKYGRRSRPTQNNDDDDLINDTSDSDNETTTTTTIVVASLDKKQSKVQRSVSQSDVHGAKRRRPLYSTKLKRCASLPSQKASKLEIRLRQLRQDREINEDSMDESDNLIKMSLLSQNLRVVWNSFEAGDVLNFQQLEIVCERVGLHKIAAKLAAEEVFEKLSIKRDGGIKFDDFLNLLQSDSDMFSSVENIGQKNVNLSHLDNKEDTQIYQDIVPTFSTESGCISNEDIVTMWTAANVPDPERLLNNLGFLSKTIKLSELCNVLEEEIQRQNTPDVLSTLLKASVALHKSEISSLRQSFRQLADENKKLFTDNKEINRRASILAQEIDERHSNLEDSTRSEIKSLEQRHNEAIRELTTQLTAEREQLGNLNSRLELKIKTMEAEELKLRQELLSLKDDNSALENEQAELHKQITELLEQNIKLNQDISEMEIGGGTDERIDSHNEEMLDLIEKIETLQIENSNLRDKNDELQSDVESLNVEVMRWKNKSKVARETLSIDEQEAITSAAIKRRGDSPSKSRNVEESPRMGKVRKFSNDIEETTENSGEWMALNSELASSTPISKATKTTQPATYQKKDEEEVIEQLKRKVLELEEKVSEYKSKIEESTCVAGNNNNDIITNSADDLTKLKNENERLQNRVKELEDNLELMSKEYENCEDYWQAKLNEERLLFDDDQRTSDEKFAELLQKMAELEDQFAAQVEKNNGRLSPIDEKCQLESQYLELENEMEELKVHARSLLDEKDKEIETLKLEVTQLQNQSIASLKTPPRASSPDNVSMASSPISYLLSQNTITGPIRDYQNPNYVTKKNNETMQEKSIIEEEPIRIISPIQKPPSSNHSQHSQQQQQQEISTDVSKELLEVNEALSMLSNKSVVSNSIQSLNEINDGAASPMSVNEGQERLRKMKIIMDQMKEEIQELATQRESLIMELQQLQEARPILANAYKSTHPNLSQKVERLQLKNKHLQNVLRQQQHYTETIMYQTWHQQRQELNELRNRLEAQSIVISEQATRLASADLLVKDLYVENSHLTATIQRMEQQITRHNLMQQFAQSKSQLGSMSSIMP